MLKIENFAMKIVLEKSDSGGLDSIFIFFLQQRCLELTSKYFPPEKAESGAVPLVGFARNDLDLKFCNFPHEKQVLTHDKHLIRSHFIFFMRVGGVESTLEVKKRCHTRFLRVSLVGFAHSNFDSILADLGSKIELYLGAEANPGYQFFVTSLK